MYRRRNYNCGCNNEIVEDIYEESCQNVVNDIYDQNECECGYDEPENGLPANPVLAQSYVPYQKMKKTYTPEVGLREGTIFPELVSPYVPGQSMAEIEYLKATNEIKGGCNNV